MIRTSDIVDKAGVVQDCYSITIKEIQAMSETRINELFESMDKEQFNDTYYKDRPEGMQLMSGYPLPKDKDGKVRNKIFVDCDFHPNCGDVEFIDCKFIRCTGEEYLQKVEEYLKKGVETQ